MDRKTVKMFIEEIVQLERKYGLTISHEDTGGAFLVELINDRDIKWLRQAVNRTTEGRKSYKWIR